MSDVSSEPGGRIVKATIKYGKGHEEPWLVFQGLPDEVRSDIIAAFGLGAESERLSLAEIVLNVAGQANAMQLASVQLGAVSIPAADSTPAEPASDPLPNPQGADEAQATQDPWAAAEQAQAQPEPEPPNRALYLAIKEITSVSDLQVLWAENQAAFTEDAELLDAWKSRGRALSGK